MSFEKRSVDRVRVDVVRKAIGTSPYPCRCRPRSDQYSTISTWCSISQPLLGLLEVSRDLCRSDVARTSAEQRNFDSYGSPHLGTFLNTVSADGGALPTVGRRSAFRTLFSHAARGANACGLSYIASNSQRSNEEHRLESNRIDSTMLGECVMQCTIFCSSARVCLLKSMTSEVFLE